MSEAHQGSSATPVLDQLRVNLARLREIKDARRETPLVSV